MKHLEVFEKYSEREEFIKYMLEYYGRDGQWHFFEPPLTRKVILKYVDDFILKRKQLNKPGEDVWGGGDSFDREYFRDYLFFKLGLKPLSELEYDITPYLTKFEVDTSKYNL